MLILNRKVGEKIVIGTDVVLSIECVAGGRVKFAIEAPNSVRILRGELVGVEAVARRAIPPPYQAVS